MAVLQLEEQRAKTEQAQANASKAQAEAGKAALELQGFGPVQLPYGA
jgi:multidrug resistance efflux pump